LHVDVLRRAEDAVDKIIEVTPELKTQRHFPCRTLATNFVGYEGYSENLQARLIQKYNLAPRVARRLARAYGGRALEVIAIHKELAEKKRELQERRQKRRHPESGSDTEKELLEQFSLDIDPDEVMSESYTGEATLLVPDYPFIEAEVIFGVRHDWVVRPEDFLARRCRLAFLNKDAALRAIPRVVHLMAQELHWNRARQSAEMQRCVEFMRHFGGPKPMARGRTVRLATRADLLEVFRKAKLSQQPGLTRDTLQLAGEMLNHALTQEEIEDCMHFAEGHVNGATAVMPPGHVSFEAFAAWWNSDRLNSKLADLKEVKSANLEDVRGTGAMFG
jgi:hypothetical protein